MVAHRKRWWAWIALLPALLTTDVRAAETSVSLSLDYEIDGLKYQLSTQIRITAGTVTKTE